MVMGVEDLPDAAFLLHGELPGSLSDPQVIDATSAVDRFP